MRYLYWLLICLSFVGCSDENEDVAKYCSSSDETLEVLARSLLAEKVDFSRIDGDLSCLISSPNSEGSFMAVLNEEIGTPPPSGRNISISGENERYFDLLIQNGIEVQRVKYSFREYLVWSEADSEKAKKLLGLDKYQNLMEDVHVFHEQPE